MIVKMGEGEATTQNCWERKTVQPLWNLLQSFLETARKIELPYGQAIPFLGGYTKKTQEI